MQLFAATFYASKQTSNGVQTAFSTHAILEENEDGARKRALEECKKKFSDFDTHQVGLCLIQDGLKVRHEVTGDVYQIHLTKLE